MHLHPPYRNKDNKGQDEETEEAANEPERCIVDHFFNYIR